MNGPRNSPTLSSIPPPIDCDRPGHFSISGVKSASVGTASTCPELTTSFDRVKSRTEALVSGLTHATVEPQTWTNFYSHSVALKERLAYLAPEFFPDELECISQREIQTCVIPTFHLSKEEVADNPQGYHKITVRYKAELKRVLEIFHVLFAERFPGRTLTITANANLDQLAIVPQVARMALQTRGVVLHLPECYRGYDIEEVEEHVATAWPTGEFFARDPLLTMICLTEHLEYLGHPECPGQDFSMVRIQSPQSGFDFLSLGVGPQSLVLDISKATAEPVDYSNGMIMVPGSLHTKIAFTRSSVRNMFPASGLTP